MSARLKRNRLCLCLLAKTDHVLARAIIEKGNGDLVQSLYECAHSILKGNVPLKKSQKGRLRRYRKDLRALEKRKSALHERKRILQKGGFVGALLAPLAKSLLAPLLISLLQSYGFRYGIRKEIRVGRSPYVGVRSIAVTFRQSYC